MNLWKLWITPARGVVARHPPMRRDGGDAYTSCHRATPRATIGSVSFSDVPTVSVDEVPDPSETAVLLDVREDDEWALGHAPGALHIPLADVPARIEEIDPDAEIYVVCRQGGRSLGAVEYLTRIGYEVFQVSGGMVAWQNSGRPLESDGDQQAKIY